MSEDISLKQIFLRRLNRIINPDFKHWFIKTILLLGVSLIGIANFTKFIGEATINIVWLSLTLNYAESNSTPLTIFGGTLVIVSILLLFFTRKTKKIVLNKNKISILMNELYKDIMNNSFSEKQKKLISINKIKEINVLLLDNHFSKLNKSIISEAPTLIEGYDTTKEILEKTLGCKFEKPNN